MSRQISIGSRVKTVKGTEGIVTEILDGGYLLENGKRVRTESIASVVKVIPPKGKKFEVGDRVTYIGAKTRYSHQYEGVLEIWEVGKSCDLDKYACLRPNGDGVTSWIEFADLQLVSSIEGGVE
jgi:hypothetical protein